VIALGICLYPSPKVKKQQAKMCAKNNVWLSYLPFPSFLIIGLCISYSFVELYFEKLIEHDKSTDTFHNYEAVLEQ
jgi:hypothetical protein